MDKRNPLDELMKTTISHICDMADTNTIIGKPIQADGMTLIPVSRLSLGVAGGGTEFSPKKQTPPSSNFGGGSGAGVKLEPVAFLVVRNGDVKLLHISPPAATTVDRVIETVPEVVDKVTGFIHQQQGKKEKKDIFE